ncbi:MAG: cytidine deaminase [Aquisalinus sp.]|nr:cytidine deaminase [Aquisalinus sp.]
MGDITNFYSILSISREMNIKSELYEAATSLLAKRYPSGWGGAAAVRIVSGEILTSVAPDTKNNALSLCIEVGAYLEAHKLNKGVTHSLCVVRNTNNSPYTILTPCGICLERLAHWGGDVNVAITNDLNEVAFRKLRDMLPNHWSKAYGETL